MRRVNSLVVALLTVTVSNAAAAGSQGPGRDCNYTLVETGYSDPYRLGPKKTYITHVGASAAAEPSVSKYTAQTYTSSIKFSLGNSSEFIGKWNALLKRAGYPISFTESEGVGAKSYIEFDIDEIFAKAVSSVNSKTITSVVLNFDVPTVLFSADVFILYSPMNYRIQHAVELRPAKRDDNSRASMYIVSLRNIERNTYRRYIRIYFERSDANSLSIKFGFADEIAVTKRPDYLDELASLERKSNVIVTRVPFASDYLKYESIPYRPLYNHELKIYTSHAKDLCGVNFPKNLLNIGLR